jgi:two-component system response regulator YesN
MIKVLMVEDESWVRRGLIEGIRWDDLGITLCGEAENGEQALALMETEKPDIVITDMKMPKVDGMAFLQEISGRRWDAEMIVISGYADYEYMHQAITSHVVEYLLKPVDEEELNDLLGKIVERVHTKRRESERRREGQLHDLIEGKYDPSGEGACLDLTYDLFSIMCIGYEFGEDEIILLPKDDEEMPGFYRQEGFRLAPGLTAILCKADSQDTKLLVQAQKKEAEKIAERAAREGTRVRVVLGGWKSDLSSIRESYTEVQQAMDYQCTGAQDIVSYNAVADVARDRIPDFSPIERLLSEGKKEEAIRLIEGVFTRMGQARYIYMPAVKKAVIDLMLALEHACKEKGQSFHGITGCGTGYIDGIKEILFLECLRDWTLDVAGSVFDALCETPQKTGAEVVAQIAHHIEHHYHEDISLTAFAESYFINPVYLSRIFKEQTGETFLECLTRVRMTHAKQYLTDGLKVKEAAALCGYANPYYFTRAYKKYYGTAPSGKTS